MQIPILGFPAFTWQQVAGLKWWGDRKEGVILTDLCSTTMKRCTWSIASPWMYDSTYLPSTQLLSVCNQSCLLGSGLTSLMYYTFIYLIYDNWKYLCAELYQWFYVACTNLTAMEHHTCVRVYISTCEASIYVLVRVQLDCVYKSIIHSNIPHSHFCICVVYL